MCIEGVGGGEGARRGVRHPGGGNSVGGAGEAAPRWIQSESGREWGRTCMCLAPPVTTQSPSVFAFDFLNIFLFQCFPFFSWLPWTGHGFSGTVGPLGVHSAASKPSTTKIGSVASLLEVV